MGRTWHDQIWRSDQGLAGTIVLSELLMNLLTFQARTFSSQKSKRRFIPSSRISFVFFCLAQLSLSLFAQQDLDEKPTSTILDLTSNVTANQIFTFTDAKNLIQPVNKGIEFKQPVGKYTPIPKLRVALSSDHEFDLWIDYEITDMPEPGPIFLSGLLIRFEYEDPSQISPVFGIATTKSRQVGFVSSAKVDRNFGQKQNIDQEIAGLQLYPNPHSKSRLLISKIQGELHFYIGQSYVSMLPLGSVACPDTPIKAIEFLCTPCKTQKTQGVFRISQIELIGQTSYNYTPPINYWAYTWPIKWILGISLLAWLGIKVWRQPELLRRKIF